MENTFITHAMISTAVGFLVQFAKKFGLNIEKQLLPICSIVIGIIGNSLYSIWQMPNATSINWADVIIGGVLAGLTASGGYDTTKGLLSKADEVKKSQKE